MVSWNSIVRVVAGIVALALVPAVWVLGIAGLPSLNAVIAARTADMVGVWIFTWSLIWITSLAGFGIAWACWSWNIEAARERGALQP